MGKSEVTQKPSKKACAKASIIVVSYNGLRETTAPCLESIFKNSGSFDYEVIVVDNNSSDETADYLKRLKERIPGLKCILNKSNRGFAGGNNDGISLASGDFLVLLNSDTLVSEGWIEGLLKPLMEDSSIGLVGPVSNAVGNEQQIFTSGKIPEDIMSEGRAWVKAAKGGNFETDMLGFFCVAFRKDLVNQVGLLDESFGLGFYEDNEYCLRVKNAGLRLVCVEDVFIYHRGGGSFRAMDAESIKKLLWTNKKRFKEKHPQSRPGEHPRDKQLKLVSDYIDQARLLGLDQGLSYRISNRLKAVGAQMPRGLFKRAKFLVRLRAVKKQLKALGLSGTNSL